jgi:hypothetical protein
VFRRGADRPSIIDLESLHLMVKAGGAQEQMLRRLKLRLFPKLGWTAVAPYAADPM